VSRAIASSPHTIARLEHDDVVDDEQGAEGVIAPIHGRVCQFVAAPDALHHDRVEPSLP
jgi:hypothetical protein